MRLRYSVAGRALVIRVERPACGGNVVAAAVIVREDADQEAAFAGLTPLPQGKQPCDGLVVRWACIGDRVAVTVRPQTGDEGGEDDGTLATAADEALPGEAVEGGLIVPLPRSLPALEETAAASRGVLGYRIAAVAVRNKTPHTLSIHFDELGGGRWLRAPPPRIPPSSAGLLVLRGGLLGKAATFCYRVGEQNEGALICSVAAKMGGAQLQAKTCSNVEAAEVFDRRKLTSSLHRDHEKSTSVLGGGKVYKLSVKPVAGTQDRLLVSLKLLDSTPPASRGNTPPPRAATPPSKVTGQ